MIPQYLHRYRQILLEKHAMLALRENSSTLVLSTAFQSNNGDLSKSICAALMCLGGKHAPLKLMYEVIEHFKTEDEKDIDCLIPGFGSSFYEGAELEDLDEELKVVFENEEFPEELRRSLAIIIKMANKINEDLMPNIAFYNSIYTHASGIGINLCEVEFIEARIPVWIKLLQS